MATKQRSKTPPASVKQRLIRLVHVAKRELLLTDENYRALLAANLTPARVQAMEAEAGQVSAKLMTMVELNQAMEAFKKAGFVVKSRGAGVRGRKGARRRKGKLSPRSRGTGASESQFAKIRALWITAYRLGAVGNRYEKGIDGFVKRQTQVDVLTWQDSTSERNKVIEGLKAIVVRELERLMGLDDIRSLGADLALTAFKEGDWEVFDKCMDALTGGEG